jgi:hypothetical protein
MQKTTRIAGAIYLSNAPGTSDPFPHTKTIEWVGFVTRIIKFVLPLVGGVLLIIGAWKGK